MKKYIAGILLLLIFCYSLMLWDTNSVVKEVGELMSGKIAEEVTEGKPIARYNYADRLCNAKVEVRITRLFVWHNFFDGYMWINYTYKTLENENGIYSAAHNIPARWKIHRENGKWEIVEIKEAP